MTHYCHPKSVVYITAHSWCCTSFRFDRCVVIHHCSIVHNSLTALKIPCVLLVIPLFTLPPPITDLIKINQLFIWLHQVSVAGLRSFLVAHRLSSCGMWALQLWIIGLVTLWHVGFQFLNQGVNSCPLHCKADSSLGHQGSSHRFLHVCIVLFFPECHIVGWNHTVYSHFKLLSFIFLICKW